ncbi:hypothetical protein AB4Z40_12475 [Bosea sp. 2YAB26]|uniref:amidohydrolase family protein n=1 Tax=Bosea sp. 2YAB26 TaxID=3237478 RepID=UPI003F92874F
MTITVIRNADVVVAWDAQAAGHVYLYGADVAFEDGKILFVGERYDGPADETVDGQGRMVMPGLVNIHSHPSSEPLNKGFLDELGRMPLCAARSSQSGCGTDRSATVVTPESSSSGRCACPRLST